MEFAELGLAGAWLVQPRIVADTRGSFVKTFHAPTFAARGLRTDFVEEYYSTSVVGVIRGMHFQLPPSDHVKLVTCLAGDVLDVVVDLRHGSPTAFRHRAIRLSAQSGMGLYLPSGCAHGFMSLSETSTMLYKVTSVHDPARDAGIAWDGIGFSWPNAQPQLSERDTRHPALADFVSPFRFDPEHPSR